MADLPDYFFVDGASEQHGPVEADEIVAHWKNGLVNETTFVFAADGSMANWSVIPEVGPLYAKITGATEPAVPLPPALPPMPPMPSQPSAPSEPADGGGGRDAMLSGIAGFNKGALKKTDSSVSAETSTSSLSSPRDALNSAISGFNSKALRKVSSEDVKPATPRAGVKPCVAPPCSGARRLERSARAAA